MWAQIFANAEYPTYYSNGDKYVDQVIFLLMQQASGTMHTRPQAKAKEIQNLIVKKGITAT